MSNLLRSGPQSARRAAGLVRRSEGGQASVELVGVLPAVLVAGLVAWQLVLAGHATWVCAHAARVAARAVLVGEDRLRAARSAVPQGLRRELTVRAAGGGRVVVFVPIPLVLPGVRSPFGVTASASLGAGS